MARKNHRKGRPQAQRRADGQASMPRSLPKPPPLESTIIPHGRCHLKHRKYRFLHSEVDKALAQAQQLRRSRGQLAHMERRYYECKTDEGGCGYWHLTSRVTYHERTTA